MSASSLYQDKPNLLAAVKLMPFSDQVKHWGSHRPWGKKGSAKGHIALRHSTGFSASAVIMNARGDILDMPVLDKPCFGRMETVLRHSRRSYIRTNQYGREVETREHRCGRCQVHEACRAVAHHRLRAHPRARAAFMGWRRVAIQEHGRARFKECFGRNHTIYTGGEGSQCGYMWQAFLGVVAAIGPFQSCNDRKLEELAEAKAQQVRLRRRNNKQKWRERQRALKRPPDAQFIADASQERDFRQCLIMEAVDCPNAPLSVRKLDERGCAITAHVWFEKTLIEEAGERATAGKVARRLHERKLFYGIGEEALRQRIHKHDFKRIDELERDRPGGPIWPPFDPLKSAEDDEWFDED